jgi:hypothetical protein
MGSLHAPAHTAAPVRPTGGVMLGMLPAGGTAGSASSVKSMTSSSAGAGAGVAWPTHGPLTSSGCLARPPHAHATPSLKKATYATVNAETLRRVADAGA